MNGSTHTGEMPLWECVQLLRGATIGHVVVIADGFPVAFPISYRLLDDGNGSTSIVMRTKPGNTIARSAGNAGFELDGIDERGGHWSVIVRGRLSLVVDATGLPDPQPGLLEGRFEWMLLAASSITGRRFPPRAGGTGAVWERG